MDDILAARFERVEKALGTLVDSIAAYNPSPQAALDLVAADDELSQGLDQLAKHQENYTRIHALRAEADALEEQLKSAVEKLASLRHELFDTPATTFPENSRAVPFDDLLQYANNISKYTVPPTYRERLPDATTDKDKEKEEEGSSGAPTNGLNTPAIVPEPADPANEPTEAPKDGENVEGAAPEITQEEAEWLKKLNDSHIAWYPWPTVDKIRSGNLYKLQYWREKHVDLDTFNIPAHEEGEMQRNMPADAMLSELKDEEVLPEVVHQPAVVPAASRPPRPKQEAFTLFDDMDDDE